MLFTRCYFINIYVSLCRCIRHCMSWFGCILSQIGGVFSINMCVALDGGWYKILLLHKCSIRGVCEWVLLCVCTSVHGSMSVQNKGAFMKFKLIHIYCWGVLYMGCACGCTLVFQTLRSISSIVMEICQNNIYFYFLESYIFIHYFCYF